MRVLNLLKFSFNFSQKLDISFLKIVYICLHWQIFGLKEFKLNLKFKNKKFAFFLSNRFELGTINDIFVKEEYNFDYIIEPKVILDLGANVGDTAIYYSLLFPDAKIYAVEPNPQVHAKLEKNVSTFPNVKICKCAVSDKTGKINLYFGDSHLGSSINMREQNTKSVEVDVYSLEDFCKMENIGIVDILKFDIEGAEEYLLQSDFIKTNVREIAVEMHDDLVSVPLLPLIEKLNLQNIVRKQISKSRYIIFGQL